MEIIIGISLPFIGTVLGSLMVYILKNNLNKNIENVILGFAGGVMVAASIWSLIIPALESSSNNSCLPVIIGMCLGIGIFLLIDFILKNRDNKDGKIKINNLMLAITLHNIPEGMAVGIALASYMSGVISFSMAFALSFGIAIQNFPEGTIISMPLYKNGFSKNKASFYGFVSALFELLGAIITLAFTNIISVILPYLLALAAGAMFYVVIVELVPESSSSNKVNVIGFMIGFLIMMFLDVTLG